MHRPSVHIMAHCPNQSFHDSWVFLSASNWCVTHVKASLKPALGTRTVRSTASRATMRLHKAAVSIVHLYALSAHDSWSVHLLSTLRVRSFFLSLLLKGDEMTTHRNPSLRSALCGSICVVLLSLVAQMRARIERVYSVKPPIRNELRKLCHAFWPCCV